MCFSPKALRAGLIVVATLSASPRVEAASLSWDGGSLIDSKWSTATNWSGDTAPGNPALPTPPDILHLAGATRLDPNVDAAWSVDALYFDSGSSAFTLSGETLTFQPSNGNSHDSRNFLFNAASASQVQTINNNLAVTSALPGAGITSLGSGISVGSGNLVLNGGLNLGTISGMRFSGGTGTVTINGIISGAPTGATAINGGAVVVLNAVNTFTNSFTIWSGVAKLGVDAPNNAPGALGNNNSAVTMGHGTSSGAKLLTNAAVTVGRDVLMVSNSTNAAYTVGGDSAHLSSFTGTIYNSASTAASVANAAIVTAVTGGRTNINTITRRSDAATSTGIDTVTKTGAGIVAFTGSSNYSGQTNVSAGTLLVNGSLTATAPNSGPVGAVVVSTGASLGGTGTIDRSVTIAAGASLAPGDIGTAGLDEAGKLTLGAGLTLNNTSNLRFDLAGPGSTIDDEVAITGNFTLDGQLSVTSLGGFGAGSYLLFSYTGSLTDNTLTFGSMPDGYAYSIDTASVPNSVYLTVVPEPGMASLLALGGALLTIRRRRK